jgi:hypothetical protein
MRSILKLAVLTSIPLEAVNLWLIGDPSAPHPLTSLSQISVLALQWDVLHMPAAILIDHSMVFREHPLACFPVLFLLGYIDTALLLLFLFWIVRLALRTLRKISSPLSRAA